MSVSPQFFREYAVAKDAVFFFDEGDIFAMDHLMEIVETTKGHELQGLV